MNWYHVMLLYVHVCTLTDNRKSKLLSRDDLVLPWQPLFALVKEVFYSKQQQLGIVYYSKCVNIMCMCVCMYVCTYVIMCVHTCACASV